CRKTSECKSPLFCSAGKCNSDTCATRVRDGAESDVDCGGTCPGCDVGKVCFVPDDCKSGQCKPDPAGSGARTGTGVSDGCSDGVKDGAETGIDCGGKCATCASGAMSTSAAACASGFYDGHFCVAD